MAPDHVASVRAHLIDVMEPEDFAALGRAMSQVREEIRESGQVIDGVEPSSGRPSEG
jgi:hypothetical protein